MQLRHAGSGKYRYLYLIETFNKNGKSSYKIIKNFGRLDYISEEELAALYAKYQDKTKLATGPHTQLSLSYAHVLIKQYYQRYLKLSPKFSELIKQAGTTNNPYQIAYALCAAKLLANSSTLKDTPKVYAQALANPLAKLSKSNVLYPALDFIQLYHRALIMHAYKTLIDSLKLRPAKFLFFGYAGCSDFDFAYPNTDSSLFSLDYQNAVILQLLNQQVDKDMILKFLSSSEYKRNLARKIRQATKKGLFVDERKEAIDSPNPPHIHSAYLTTDERGLPLDLDLRKHSDIPEAYSYIPESVESLKEQKALPTYYVDMHRLASFEHLQELQAKDYGFLVEYPLLELSQEHISSILDKEGWKKLNLSQSDWRACAQEDLDGLEYQYKLADFTQSFSTLHKDADGKWQHGTKQLKCKVIYLFSAKRQLRDKLSLQQLFKQAKKAIFDGALITDPDSAGWQSLLYRDDEDYEDYNKAPSFVAAQLDEYKVQLLQDLCGYTALLFNPASSQSESSIAQVLAGAKQMLSLKDRFNELEPVVDCSTNYLPKASSRVLAHSVLCLNALSILKILQQQLSKLDGYYSLAQIQQALRSFKVQAIGNTELHRLVFKTNSTIVVGAGNHKESFTKLRESLYKLTQLNALEDLETPDSLRKKLKISTQHILLSEEQLTSLLKDKED